ncbi:CTP synthase, partial [Streptomyces cyaneofuscatus]
EVHPYLVATQAHPELRSRPTRPHPLFAGLVKAAVTRHEAAHREVETADRQGTAQGRAQQAPGTVGCT